MRYKKSVSSQNDVTPHQITDSQDAAVGPALLQDLQDEGLDVFCWCNRCGHNAEIALAVFLKRFNLTHPVPELARAMRCKNCQATDIITRAAWPAYGGQIERHNK